MNMMATEDEQAVWPYKLLTKEAHGRLVANMDDIASVAGVPVDSLDLSMKESGCGTGEIDWVKNYPTLKFAKKKGGLLLVGAFAPVPEKRMIAATAAFIRNYVDARFVNLRTLIPKDGEAPDINPTVLLIPDLCRQSVKQGHALMHWEAQYVQGLLVERFAQRRATLLHVDSLDLIEKEFGKTFLDFLVGDWDIIKSK